MTRPQYYRSDSLEGLEYQQKYGLADWTSGDAPLIMFGMYRESDIIHFESHRAHVTVVWQGSDARNLPADWLAILKSKPDTRHIAISSFIFDSLTAYGLNPQLLFLSATVPTPELENTTNGDFVHFYSSFSGVDNARYLGEHLIPTIIQKTGIPIIHTGFGLYDRPELYGIYRSCFLHLRLTEYDGCPNTNLEMGLLGRKSVFNGYGIPHSIPWVDVEHICDIILEEYDNRKKDNSAVSRDIKNFINQNML